MSVVNVKVGNIRPKYKNLKEWTEESGNVYIGRKGIVFIDGERFPKEDSIWANPFKVGKDGTREEVIKKYETHIKAKIISGKANLKDIKGKNLGCWCKPESCHGDILLRLLEGI